MAKRNLNLTYALKDGAIVNIDDVERGLKCACTCPACGEMLIARKGEKVMHHFSHRSGTACEYGYETSLHLAAKEILSAAKCITIPAVYTEFPTTSKEKQLVSGPKEIMIDSVELEKRFDDIVPDVVIHAGGQILFMEIYVTHKIDSEKLKKIRTANISTVEIDLSKMDHMISTQELSTILLEDGEVKRWAYNRVSEKYLQRFYRISDKRKVVANGFALRIDGCPIKARMWRGKPYANFIDDCAYCEYLIYHESADLQEDYEPDEWILCSGRTRISSISDFNKSEKRRIADSDSTIEDIKESALAGGTCPNCGSPMVKRHGTRGMFWGCSNYPHCRFTAEANPETGDIIVKLRPC